MSSFWEIVRWEVMRNLRNKQFILGMFVTPLVMGLFMAVPALLERLDTPRTFTYAVVDRLGAFDRLSSFITSEHVRLELYPDAETAAARIADDGGDGYLVLDRAFIDTGAIQVYMENTRDRIAPELYGALTQLLQGSRIAEAGLDPASIQRLTAPARVQPTPLRPEEAADPAANPFARRMPTAIATGALLVVLIMASGAMLLQSALQEKRDRMSEVVLSSIDPDTLMSGKIAGHFILGAIQIAVWLAIGLPTVTLLSDARIFDMIAFDMLPLFCLIFLLGYLFFAAIFVGVGATVEDIQGASNSQGMVFMLPFLSFVILFPVINNPTGLIAKAGTFFPITTPFILILRLGITEVAVWEIALGLGILLLFTILVTKVAARIFRVGMLMYGKNATPREIWRWLRYG